MGAVGVNVPTVSEESPIDALHFHSRKGEYLQIDRNCTHILRFLTPPLVRAPICAFGRNVPKDIRHLDAYAEFTYYLVVFFLSMLII